MEFVHVPVMAQECIRGLNIDPGGIYFDGTVGGAGHSALIAGKLSRGGRLICVDKDADAVGTARERLKQFQNAVVVRDSFFNAAAILDKLEIELVNGILLDLGVSSWQLDEAERGFSFSLDARLDMRMDRDGELTAFDVVNGYAEGQLKRILIEFGEERYAGRVARAIAACRVDKPIASTAELADIVCRAIPRAFWEANKHPATRTFQAIRIEVNGELNGLGQALEDMAARLAPGGRLCVISFHSLEDRIVKTTFKELTDPCKCPRSLPYCICGKTPVAKLVTKKPITPTSEEVAANHRARSAKLRVLEKLES